MSVSTKINELLKIVESMKHTNLNISEIISEKNTLYKCILCKKKLSSQRWSIIMENHIKDLFGISIKKNNVSGDGIINGKTVEIKVSLGDKNGGFNFVQIRPSHHIHYYIFLLYDLNLTEYGTIFWICMSSNELYHLLPKYGNYAHGTVNKNGNITMDSIVRNNNLEYAIRCNNTKTTTSKQYKTWIMLKNYVKTEDEIRKMLA